MTIVMSIVSSDWITLTVDSAVTQDFGDHREYEPGPKLWCIGGVGCIATWGARDGNQIGNLVIQLRTEAGTLSPDQVAHKVDNYLRQEYRPHELGLEDVGYHVAGFEKERPRLHHLVWGIRRPALSTSSPVQEYHWSQHHPVGQEIQLVYNGRNDLAERVVLSLLDEIGPGRDTNFNLADPIDCIRFGDFVARFAAELTPQVGPPFRTAIILPDGHIGEVANDGPCPIARETIVNELARLGLVMRPNKLRG